MINSTKFGAAPTLWLLSVSILCIAIAPFLGSTNYSVSDFLLSGDVVAREIFWNIRVPRVLLGFLTGAGLGIAGLVFQSIFRNPLATPYTLGIASGASAGAVLAIHLGLTGVFLGVSMISISSILGALAAMSLVYSLAHYLKYYSVVTMLLIGVALNFFFSSFILILQYFNDFSQSFQVVRWLMGGLEIVGFEPIFYLLPIVLGVSLIVFFKASELDLLSLGDEFALSRGLSVERERIFLIAMVALVVGFIVAFSGPIGFVGMMMPHICRMLLGVPHRRLVPVVFMLAGAFLVACDSFARIVAAPAEIPVGVITALLGGPFFLWIIISQNRSVSR